MTTTWTAKKIDIREKNGHLTVIGSTPATDLTGSSSPSARRTG